MIYTVAEAMSSPVVSVDRDTTVAAALTLMRRKGISSVLVRPTGPNDEWGIMTKRDVISKVVARDLDPRAIRVADIMTAHLITAHPDWTLKECSNKMMAVGVRRLPVVNDQGEVVGIISDTDIFTAVEERGWEGP